MFEHDDDGNLSEAPNGDGEIAPGRQVRYEWDAENRLIRVAPASSPASGDKKVEYTYDYMNRRVERKVYEYSSGWGSPSEHTRYVYHGWNVILELDALGSNAILKKYTWGLDLAGQNGSVNSMDQAAGITGLLACLDTAGTPSTGDDRTFVYCYDANGNVTQLVETSTSSGYSSNYGTLQAAYEYDAYGNTIVASFGYADDNLIRFSTRPVDPLTLLGHWPMRVLDFERGRWTSRDPIAETGGACLYSYCYSRPIDHTDALSQSPEDYRWSVQVSANGVRRGAIGFSVTLTLSGNTCCRRVRFVQVVKESQTYTIGAITWTRNTNWTVDSSYWTGLPPFLPWYDSSLTSCRPTAVGGSQYNMGDEPGKKWRDIFTTSLSQDFETCAVCIFGSQSSTQGCIIGCVQWGHTWVRGSPDFHVSYGDRAHRGPASAPILTYLGQFGLLWNGFPIANSCP